MTGIPSQSPLRSGTTLQASALRVMYISKRDAARQWNSRKRRKFIENYTFRRHQRQYFIKISKNTICMHGGLHSFSASPVGRMLWFLDLWVYLNPIDLQKIHVVKTNVHNSRKLKKTTQIASLQWRAFVRKIPPALVLLYKLALYESCVIASATPQGNEIRVSEKDY